MKFYGSDAALARKQLPEEKQKTFLERFLITQMGRAELRSSLFTASNN
jgi:hypothetical protein